MFLCHVFSDFEVPAPPKQKKMRKFSSPSCRPFPAPPCPIQEMSRNQFGNYATKLVDYVCEGSNKRGEGESKQWEMKVEASRLSLKLICALKLERNDLVSLSQFRKWGSLKFQGSFKQGPGKRCDKWEVGKSISWSLFLQVIVEVLSVINDASSSYRQPALPPQERGGHQDDDVHDLGTCLLYTSPSPRDMRRSRMPSSA